MLDKLKRKYGGTLAEVISTGQKLAEELAGIEFSTQNIEELEKKFPAFMRNWLKSRGHYRETSGLCKSAFCLYSRKT